MMKIKKLFAILPIILVLSLSVIMLSACNNNENEKDAIFVSNITELNEAIENTDENHVIKLENNIGSDGEGVASIVIFPINKSYDVHIDLNGFNLNAYVRISGKQNGVEATNDVNLKIENSKNIGGVVGFENDEYPYAFMVLSNSKNTVQLKNVTFKAQYGGIYTNGTYNGNTVINAEDCKFISTHSNTISDAKDGGVGAYLASKNYTYNFEDCYFEGYTGYHTKHGIHNLIDCEIKAVGTTDFDPAYYGNGGSATGNALMIESASDYAPLNDEKTLIINIDGGRFVSLAKYAIEEASTANQGSNEICYAQINVKGNPILNGEGNKTVKSENAIIR